MTKVSKGKKRKPLIPGKGLDKEVGDLLSPMNIEQIPPLLEEAKPINAV